MLSSFVLAIVTHPEVQVKGQREIDSVVGRERLPDFNDRPFLPYITAIVKEVLRNVFFILSFVSCSCLLQVESRCPARFVPVRYVLLKLTWDCQVFLIWSPKMTSITDTLFLREH